MRWYFPILLCLASSLPLILDTTVRASDDSIPWKFETERSGIRIYCRDIPGSSVVDVKGEGEVDAPIDRVASDIMNVPKAVEWVDRLAESRLVKIISSDEYVVYNHVETPFVMKDRDLVVDVKVVLDRAAKTVDIRSKSYESSDPAFGIPPVGPYVRMNLESGSFFLKSIENGKKTYLVGTVHADPMGSVPKWLVNIFQKDWPLDTFEGIRTQVKKPAGPPPQGFEAIITEIASFK